MRNVNMNMQNAINIVPYLTMIGLIGYIVNLLVIGDYDKISISVFWMLMCACTTLVISNTIELLSTAHWEIGRVIGMLLIILSYLLNMITYLVGYSSDNIITNTSIKIVGNILLVCAIPSFFTSWKLTRKQVLKLVIFSFLAPCIYNVLEFISSLIINANPCQFYWWVVLYNSLSSVLFGVYLYLGYQSNEKSTSILCVAQSGLLYGENYHTNSFCVSDANYFLRVSIPILCAYQLIFVTCLVTNKPSPPVDVQHVDLSSIEISIPVIGGALPQKVNQDDETGDHDQCNNYK